MKASSFFILSFLIVVALLDSARATDLATLQAQAAKGDAEAELDLGRDYHQGTEVPQDFAKAATYYHQAAAQGNAKAMYNIGYLYAHGQGVPQDMAKAAEWYRKAADKGLPAGELSLGMLYYKGDENFKKDPVAAVKWLTLAAQHEDTPAQAGPAANALGDIYGAGLKPVAEDDGKSLLWYTKAAELGYDLAQLNLGSSYFQETNHPEDHVKAYIWLKLAADQGNIMAVKLLADYASGKAFSDGEVAEGNRQVRAYEMKRRMNRTALIALEPIAPAALKPSVSSAPSAAPAVGAPPVAATAAPVVGGGHTN